MARRISRNSVNRQWQMNAMGLNRVECTKRMKVPGRLIFGHETFQTFVLSHLQLRYIGALLRHRAALFLLIVAMIAGAALAYWGYVPYIYSSKARIDIEKLHSDIEPGAF